MDYDRATKEGARGKSLKDESPEYVLTQYRKAMIQNISLRRAHQRAEDNVHELLLERAELRAEVERLKADEERLDWIEKTHPLGLLDIQSEEVGHVYGFNAITGDKTLYGSFRDALDSAREK